MLNRPFPISSMTHSEDNSPNLVASRRDGMNTLSTSSSQTNSCLPSVVVDHHHDTDSAVSPDSGPSHSLTNGIGLGGNARLQISVGGELPVTNGHDQPDGHYDCPQRFSPDSAAIMMAQKSYLDGQQRCSLPAPSARRHYLSKRSSTLPATDEMEGLLSSFRRRSATIETRKIERTETKTEETVNQYRILGQLGEGSFGMVCEAEATNTGEKFAVKILSKSRMARISKRTTFGRSPRASPAHGRPHPRASPGGAPPTRADPLQQVKKEIAILKNLDHPCVINLFEVLDDPEDDNIFMVFELMPSGSVMDDDMDEIFDEALSLSYFIDLMLGVEYLHAHNIAHRDIKPQNILLNSTKDHVKITDFGVSEWFSDDEGSDSSPNAGAGSPAFMAPETLQTGARGTKTDFDAKKADIWAMGVTLYCFLCGQLPFASRNPIELHEQIKEMTPEFPESCEISEDCKDFILKCLIKDPSERITITQMRSHPWIREVKLPSVDENCGNVEQVTEEEIAAAFSSKPISYLESLLLALSQSGQDSIDGMGASMDSSYSGVNFLSLQDRTRSGSRTSHHSAHSAHSAMGSVRSGCSSPEFSDLTPEQESIILRLAMAKRPSFSDRRWSPANRSISPGDSARSEGVLTKDGRMISLSSADGEGSIDGNDVPELDLSSVTLQHPTHCLSPLSIPSSSTHSKMVWDSDTLVSPRSPSSPRGLLVRQEASDYGHNSPTPEMLESDLPSQSSVTSHINQFSEDSLPLQTALSSRDESLPPRLSEDWEDVLTPRAEPIRQDSSGNNIVKACSSKKFFAWLSQSLETDV